jgi:hypothetical protein
MAYESVDQLQKMLADSVFGYAQDRKKAAGRALGTLVEIITFYLLKSWGLETSVAIERGLGEYKNPSISHNVEYSLHPIKFKASLILESYGLPLTSSKIFKEFMDKLKHLREFKQKINQLLSRERILRNSCVIGETEDLLLVGLVKELQGEGLELDLVAQYRSPYAMFECKRVGVEDGMKKGPQTIEKAKQGAYVARTVSCLQKIRIHSGELHGVVSKRDGTLYSKAYPELIEEIVNCSDAELLRNFILTVGVVSNHGNWFTSENQNKELMVLAQSYDWLLFLTDAGLSEFIRDVLLADTPEMAPARAAFKSSYSATRTKNSFTKVQMALEADTVLQKYFTSNSTKIASWFNIITPESKDLTMMRSQIAKLAGKDWWRIHKA